MLEVKALLFDVFGTVVDWRTGIAIEVQMIAKKYNIELNADDFADAWRAEYQPAMEQIRSGKRSFTILDILHLENLNLTMVFQSSVQLATFLVIVVE